MNSYQKKQVKGTALVEYVLITALVALAAAGVLTTVEGSIKTLFISAAQSISSA